MFRYLIGTALLIATLQAQRLQPEWDKTYGADKEEKAYDLVITRDQAIAVCGVSRSFSRGKEDIYLFKTDANGQLLWEKRIGGTEKDLCRGIDESSDGTLYLGGTSRSYSKEGNYDLYVAKRDRSGNPIWAKVVGGKGKDYGYDLVATRDGGVVIVGKTKSFGQGRYDAYVAKFSADGKRLWSKTFGGKENEEAQGVTELSDGSLIVVGSTESYGAGDFDFYIFKLSPEGKKLWERYYGGEKDDQLYAVTPLSDGGFAATGYTRSYGSQKKDLSVVRFDAKGNLLWHKIAGGVNHEIGYGIAPTTSDGLIVTGMTKSRGHGKEDLYLLLFDKNGKPLADKTLGGKKNDSAHAIVRTPGGDYIVAGASESFGKEDEYDAYLLRIDVQ